MSCETAPCKALLRCFSVVAVLLAAMRTAAAACVACMEAVGNDVLLRDPPTLPIGGGACH